jgi:hypothetical protein
MAAAFGYPADQAVPSSRLAARPDWSPRVNAPLAQSAERFHGKEKVNGSIPLGGSADAGQAAAHHEGLGPEAM